MSLDLRVRVADRGLDVAFAVPEGGRLALLGPNGAGKSSVLAVLAGLLVPDEGRATLGARTLFDLGADGSGAWTPAHERRLALLPQGGLLLPHLSVLDNVAFGPRSQGRGKASARAVARERLGDVGARDLADRRPRQLSGGQAQRVALARTLAADPKLLLLDEPLAAVDADSRPELRRLLRTVLADRPAVLVTHDEQDARELSDHVVRLEVGRVVASGPTAELLPDSPT